MLVVAGGVFGACANVTNMQLGAWRCAAQGNGDPTITGREQRKAPTAVFIENLVLTALVGVCGVLLAAWISNLIIADRPPTWNSVLCDAPGWARIRICPFSPHC